MENKEKLITYFLGSVAAKVLPFLFLPYILSKLSIEEYGQVILTLTIVSIVTAIQLYAANAAYISFKTKNANNEGEFTSAIAIIFINTILLMWLALCYWYYSGVFRTEVVYAGIIATIVSAHSMVLAFHQEKNEEKKYTVINLITVIANIFITYIIFEKIEANYENRILAIILSYCVTCYVTVIYIKREKAQLKKIRKTIKRMYKFGNGLAIHTISGILITTSDRLIVSKYLTVSDVGIYGLAYQLAMPISLIMTAINTTYAKKIIENSQEEIKIEKKYIKIIIPIIFLFYLVTALYVEIFMPTRVSEVLYLIPLAMIFYLFNGFAAVYSNKYYGNDDTFSISVATFVGLIINLFLNLLFVPKYGLYAAAVVSVISQLCILLILIMKHQKKPS